MDFRQLQARLLANLLARVHNGEITERGLARLTGISQPHIHNMLKGARPLLPDMADVILHRLRIDLAALLQADERAPDCAECRCVPLLNGWIGTGYPFPETPGRARYPFQATHVDLLEAPVAAALVADSGHAQGFQSGGVVLLDCAAGAVQTPDEASYYALETAGGGAIGLVRRGAGGWRIWSQESGKAGGSAVIKGRVSLMVQGF